ncbi:hypothetical protein J007_00319 [Cryptococcus neoformans]|nr:hypothetical protein J007_00319 [Cryptococcus neoformans var. grubii]OXC66177.1 hypothetical protein C358_00315 [Cryptococcus neoformans var. grubii MW-RSA852]
MSQVTFEVLRDTKSSPGNLSSQSSPLPTTRSDATYATSVITNDGQDSDLVASDSENQSSRRAASEADEPNIWDRESDDSEVAINHSSNPSTSSFSASQQFYRSEGAIEVDSGSDSDTNNSSPSQRSSDIEYAEEAEKVPGWQYNNSPSLTVDSSHGVLAIPSNESYRVAATETGSQRESTTLVGSEDERYTLAEDSRHLLAAYPKRHRTVQHVMARFSALYIFPILVAVPVTLLLSLNTILLTPLYNTIPLSLHKVALYTLYAAPPTLLYWAVTLERSAREVVSANVCINLAALNGDLVAVLGRRLGSLMGRLAGPEWGACLAKAILGFGAVGGGLTFALLCFDHILPITPAKSLTGRIRNLANVSARSTAYMLHLWFGQRLLDRRLSSSVMFLTRSPEKAILFITLYLTTIHLFVRPGPSLASSLNELYGFISFGLGVAPSKKSGLPKYTALLPKRAPSFILFLRLPLLVLALRQQIFLRPPGQKTDPYVTAHGELRVLSSEQSFTGRVVVGDNLKDGYRFLRCDHSILGGRWFRERENNGEKTVELGDSIFAVFNLQEVMTLAHRSDENESLITTLDLTTDLKVTSEGKEDEEPPRGSPSNRALVIGLGAGITAQGFLRRGFNVDVVEIDPAVFTATETYFNLSSSHLTSVNLLDGSAFISELASLSHVNITDPSLDSETLTALEKLPKWDFVVQDCFTGGSVPGEMFTKEFWEDLGEMVAEDGLIAMNFVGLKMSKASKAVLVTLTSVFPQCRAFGDGYEINQGPNDITNMVVFCTKTHSPILTFRRPRPSDVHRSPLRSHVFSTFLPNEIQLDSIISEEDYHDVFMTLRRGHTARLDYWQKETAIATWRAMQKILTPEMWMAY